MRCEIDGVLKHKGQDELLSVKALNEFDPKLTGLASVSSLTVTTLSKAAVCWLPKVQTLPRLLLSVHDFCLAYHPAWLLVTANTMPPISGLP